MPVQYISGKMMLVRAIERKLKVIISVPSSAPEISENGILCNDTIGFQNSLDKIRFGQKISSLEEQPFLKS